MSSNNPRTLAISKINHLVLFTTCPNELDDVQRLRVSWFETALIL
jgi:hypothetical protein